MSVPAKSDLPPAPLSSLPPTLRWSAAWAFPVSSPQARAGVLRGALALLTLLPGWVLNLGYRWDVATRLYLGTVPTFPPLRWSRRVVRQGLVVWGVIAISLSPGAVLALLGGGARLARAQALAQGLWLLAGLLLLAAFLLVPAGMTRLGCQGDRTVFTAPWRLWRPVRLRLGAYLYAWCIAGSAIAVSLAVPAVLGAAGWLSLWTWVHTVPALRPPPALHSITVLEGLAFLLNTVLFFVLSVWAWQVAGYAFTVALYGGYPQGKPVD
ncbi:hypothetical protein [Deinococcus puniceus]|uniref:hypothetical protein n=1 Tax=Deinococcus puniceus TaxID=1182568 RepID=UPI000ACF296A|nr:hypothetical protein [Deinococcus puniceus]